MNGIAFGLVAVALMISRIEVSQGMFVDARAVPIALVTLVEGGWAGLVAALVASAYRVAGRLRRAGRRAGAPRDRAAGAPAVAVGAPRGRVRARHAWALGAAVYVITFASFALVGAHGFDLFAEAGCRC